MSQTKTITTYKVSAFDSKAAAEGGLCVMVASTYEPSQNEGVIDTTANSNTIKGTGICKCVNPDKFLFTVDSIVYTFNSEGKAANLNSVGMKLLMGAITETLATAGARVTKGFGENASAYDITSLSARDEFAIQALRGLLRTIEDPASLSDTEKRYYCDVAYQWAANMMQSAAYTRQNAVNPADVSVPDVEGIVGALDDVSTAISHININSSSSGGSTDVSGIVNKLEDIDFADGASLIVQTDSANSLGADSTIPMHNVLKNDVDDNDNVIPLKVDQISWEYLGRFNLSTGSYGVIPEYHFMIPCLVHNQYVKIELYNSNDIKQDNNILCDYQRITEYYDKNLDLVTEAEETGLHLSISLGAAGYISIADRSETNYIALTRAGSQHFESGDYLKIYVCGNVGNSVSSETPGTGEVNIGSSGCGGSSSNPFYINMPGYLPLNGEAVSAKVANGLKNGSDEIVYINPPNYHDFNGDSGMYSWYTGTSGKDYYKAVLKWICTAWNRRSEYANKNVTFFMKCNPNALNFAILTIYNLSIVYDNSNQSTEPEKIDAVGLPQYSFGMAITFGNGLSFSLFGTTELNGETGNEVGFDYYFNNGYVWNAQTAGSTTKIATTRNNANVTVLEATSNNTQIHDDVVVDASKTLKFGSNKVRTTRDLLTNVLSGLFQAFENINIGITCNFNDDSLISPATFSVYYLVDPFEGQTGVGYFKGSIEVSGVTYSNPIVYIDSRHEVSLCSDGGGSGSNFDTGDILYLYVPATKSKTYTTISGDANTTVGIIMNTILSKLPSGYSANTYEIGYERHYINPNNTGVNYYISAY